MGNKQQSMIVSVFILESSVVKGRYYSLSCTCGRNYKVSVVIKYLTFNFQFIQDGFLEGIRLYVEGIRVHGLIFVFSFFKRNGIT